MITKEISNWKLKKEDSGVFEVNKRILTAKPTVPSPKMATVDPFSTFAVLQAAPTPGTK